MDRASYIQIASGRIFDPLDPDPERITIEDIAASLAKLCRFNGHVNSFYSVAEHSVHVSRACAPTDALWGLLHDAPEYATGDLSSPLKGTEDLGALFKRYEDRLMGAVIERFFLGPVEPPSVSRADEAMLELERKTLIPRTPEGDELWAEWTSDVDTGWLPAVCAPAGWSPPLAEVLFLERYKEILYAQAGR